MFPFILAQPWVLIQNLCDKLEGFSDEFCGIMVQDCVIRMKPPLYQRYGDEKARTIVVSSKASIIKQRPAWWNFFIAVVVYLLGAGIIQVIWVLPYLRFF
jgi:hypothetical protein